jgi:hypothetical protein
LIEAHASSLPFQLQKLADARTWYERSQISVIVIPVKIEGNWCLYQIVRGSHIQQVVRLTEAPMTNNVEGATALGEIDQLIHLITRGAVRTWARMLLRDAPAEGFNLEELRRRAQIDAAKDDY